MNKIAIYTAAIGGRDLPRTDIECWNEPRQTTNRLSAREYKILSHYFMPGDYSLWIDANTYFRPELAADKIEEAVNGWIEKYLKTADMAVMRHPIRDCIYQEANACKYLELDDAKTIDRQMKRYREEGYPESNGLAATTYILRRHTKLIRQFNNFWWEQVFGGSIRDQLSFDYCCWRMNVKYNVIEGEWPNNDLLIYKPHAGDY